MEVQGAKTTAMKQPFTVKATLHMSYPQHDMIHEQESKLNMFADSCPPQPQGADDIPGPCGAKPALVLQTIHTVGCLYSNTRRHTVPNMRL